MDSKKPRPMTPFDDLVTLPHIYTLKLLLPYTPPSMQRMLGIFLKFQELQQALSHFYGFGKVTSDPYDMVDVLKDYMSSEEQEMMEQMEMMMNMMEMMKDMPDMSDMPDMNAFGDIFGSMLHPSDTDEQKGDPDHE